MANESEVRAGEATEASEAETPAEAAVTSAEAAEASPPPAPVQTVPFERFRAVVGQRSEREAQLQEARRQLDLANATIEEFKRLSEGAAGAAASASPAPRAPSPAEIETLVAAETSRRDFTRQCNEAFTAGKAAHADFEKVIADLNALSPVFDSRLQRPVMPQSLVEAALATGTAHEVLYALGRDSSLADRVLSMPPLQQAAELTRLSMKLAEAAAAQAETTEAPAQVSKAPAPVRPKVTGSGSTVPAWDPAATDKFSTEEWIAKREADIKRAREATRH